MWGDGGPLAAFVVGVGAVVGPGIVARATNSDSTLFLDQFVISICQGFWILVCVLLAVTNVWFGAAFRLS